jgi:hypothetical protein
MPLKRPTKNRDYDQNNHISAKTTPFYTILITKDAQ